VATPGFHYWFHTYFAVVEIEDQGISYNNVRNIYSACTNKPLFSVSRLVPVLSEYAEIRLSRLDGSIFQLSLYLAVIDRQHSLQEGQWR